MYFRLAMLSILAFAVLAALSILHSDIGADPRTAVWLGILAFVGVFVSGITGMIYKIVPFLNWLHLQRLGAPLTAVPNMKKMIPADAMTGQLRLHILAVALLLAVGLATRTYPAGRRNLCSFMCMAGLEPGGRGQALPGFQRSNSRNCLTLLIVICLPLTQINPLAERS
ncbi:MAG: hypothetical protein V9E90_08780 [Saprospiraceae bacterium]